MGFKTAISSGRRVYIASHSVYKQRGTAVLFVNFNLFIMEIQLCKCYAHTPVRFVLMI